MKGMGNGVKSFKEGMVEPSEEEILHLESILKYYARYSFGLLLW